VAKDVQYDKHPLSLHHSCTEGTRTQILDDLMHWACDSSGCNIYWFCRIAGTGKMTMAYSFCEHLKAKDLLGASFFCSRTINESCDIRDVFPSIAHELAFNFAVSLPLLAKTVNEDQGITSSQPDVQFICLICNSLHPDPNKPCIITFNAFNEFKTMTDACLLLTRLIHYVPSLPNIKFFITSQ
jgi:hypothetical protein